MTKSYYYSKEELKENFGFERTLEANIEWQKKLLGATDLEKMWMPYSNNILIVTGRFKGGLDEVSKGGVLIPGSAVARQNENWAIKAQIGRVVSFSLDSFIDKDRWPEEGGGPPIRHGDYVRFSPHHAIRDVWNKTWHIVWVPETSIISYGKNASLISTVAMKSEEEMQQEFENATGLGLDFSVNE